MEEIERWLNCAAANTYDADSKKMAAVALVGTHFDQVRATAAATSAASAASNSQPETFVRADCVDISNKLFSALQSCIAWPFLLSNDLGRDNRGARTQLNFFAVDNTQGRSDPGLQQLMELIQTQVCMKSRSYL